MPFCSPLNAATAKYGNYCSPQIIQELIGGAIICALSGNTLKVLVSRQRNMLYWGQTVWGGGPGSRVCFDWEDVSLYRNPFNEVISLAAFAGDLSGDSFSSTSPEFGTDGRFAKCWVRENDDIFLLKSGSDLC